MAEIYSFLKLDGIEGESQDSEYQNQIELQSFSWGAVNNSSFKHGTGASIGRGDVHDISISKYTDKSSPNLFNYCTTGKHIPSGELTLLKLSGDTKIAYMKIVLTDIVVTSWQIGAHNSGELPVEQVSLNFVKFQMTYLPQGDTGDPQGNVEFGWNIQQNKAA